MTISVDELAEMRTAAVEALQHGESYAMAELTLVLLDEIDLLRNRIAQAKLHLDGRVHS